METETSVGSSVTALDFGGGIESSFSFANSVPLSAPSEISLGGTFGSGFTSFSDLKILDSSLITQNDNFIGAEIPSVFEQEFTDINLDPDLPSYEIPQVFQDAFIEESVAEDLLTPPSYLKSILEPNIVVDIYEPELQSTNLGQINYSIEPEIAITEAKLTEIFGEPLTAPKVEILERKIEDLANFETVYQPESIQIYDGSRISEAKQSSTESDQIATLLSVARNDIVDEISGSALHINDQAYPEIIQATRTYESLKIAGIAEVQAVELVQNALVLAGTEPKVARQTMVQVKTGQTKVGTSYQTVKVAKKEEEPVEEKEDEEKKKKKKVLKFVVDIKALFKRMGFLARAVQLVPTKKEMGKDIVDSNEVVALMPTEVENPAVKSEILPEYVLEWLNYGDGAYRDALATIRDLGLRSRQSILEQGLKINRDLPPVTIAEVGEEVKQVDVDRVLTYKPDPIRHLRK